MAFAIIAATVIQLVGEYLFTRKITEREPTITALSLKITQSFLNLDAYTLNDELKSVKDDYTIIAVLDGNLTVQADSDCLLNGKKLKLQDAQTALNGSTLTSAYYLGGDIDSLNLQSDGVYAVYCVPLKGEQETLGVLLAVTDAGEIFSGLIYVIKQIGFIMLIVLGIVGIISNLIIKRFTYPVRELEAGLGKLTSGDFTVRVEEKGNNEFTQLAHAFNTMTTRMETLDRSRNQFVSNASHELKTPLSTMKILIQTLVYQEVFDPGLTKEFLTDIDKEIDRLAAVVSDLLTLVGTDSGETKLNYEEISLNGLLLDNVKRLSPLAHENGIELEHDCQSIMLYGDKSKLTQVFYNLIDNAVKYTPRGGQVAVTCEKRGKLAVIEISDNGIGIPEEDQLHIFDRFYRVDKARSRETGGTGLGLSIVKQIILMHQGSISVSSKVDEGTVFTVKLPIKQA